jgi:hypothetical protein
MRGRKRCSTNVKIPFRGLVPKNRDVWERTPCRTGDQEYHMAGTRVFALMQVFTGEANHER